MKQFKRVMLFLLDSVGIGALPDAEKYGDAGTATIQHTLEGNPGLTLPNMERLAPGRLWKVHGAVQGQGLHCGALGGYGRSHPNGI